MRTSIVAIMIAFGAVGCTDETDPERTEDRTELTIERPDRDPSLPIAFEQIDDNVKHDTLLIQTTFDLKDGTFLMVASHKLSEEKLNEGDREAGLRLYHYRAKPDSTYEILARSASANDSWTMFPTFFADPIEEGSYIILANFGERNSWGQKVIRFGDQGFTDLGYLNLAKIERQGEGEEMELKHRNIAPETRVTREGDQLVFSFALNELILFDDLRGVLDQPIEAGRVQYRWSEAEGMVLYIDGEARREEQPS